MPLTQEKPLDGNFSNNNDHSYLHKKFKKMASTTSVLSANQPKSGDSRHIEPNVAHSHCITSITNGSIAASHPEIEKIKENHKVDVIDAENNVQTNFYKDRIRDVNNIVQVSGQTSVTYEFLNKTENIEHDFIRDSINGGGTGGRYICPYCKLSCTKPSVLQKHIRAHTNERPYPCVPCGFAFKTKSNLYKHRRSRTHALRLQGADVSSVNDDDYSGGSESDSSIPPASLSDTGSEPSILRFDNSRPNEVSSPELTSDNNTNSLANDNNKSKSIYKPKFRAALYQECDSKNKLKRTISQNADFLTEHISKIISDNEAIVDVIDTPLQKKYGKIKQIAESKQFLNETSEIKQESTPLNLTKSNNESESSFRKRSHSETFSHNMDYNKHPLNPEGSIIKDLLLKTKANGLMTVTSETVDGIGSLFICPFCQIIYKSAENLEVHRLYYCKGNSSNNPLTSNNSKETVKVQRPDSVFVRSNSVNVRLSETVTNANSKLNKSPPLKIKPENLVITNPDTNEVIAPLPSPGPLLGNTRLVDTRVCSDLSRKSENVKVKPTGSPKRRLDNRSDTYSPRSVENISPRSMDLYPPSKLRYVEAGSSSFRTIDDLPSHIRHNTTSLQMFGGEVKIVDHSGGTTTLRIEPSKNQLSPILIQQNLSPSKLDEASSVVVRSGLHSGGTIMHNPPTPKEIITTPQPKNPRVSITNAPGMSSIPGMTHFQFPPLSAITAYNPLTLPPLSPSSTPSGASTILHGGKLIPHVPGMPGPNTPGLFVGSPKLQSKTVHSEDKYLLSPSENQHVGLVQTVKITSDSKYESIRNARSPIRSLNIDTDKQSNNYRIESPNYPATIPVIKVKNMDDASILPKIYSNNIIRPLIGRQDVAVKRNYEGIPRTSTFQLKETTTHSLSKIKTKLNVSTSSKIIDTKIEEIKNFNFENLITKAEIYNNQIPSSSEVQKNTNAQETPITSNYNERSETSYFQKNNVTKAPLEENKPKFLRPSTLPLKPGTFTPKKHHGITPNANTMPLVSPETPRPAKAYGQLYLNGNAYTYLGLKCSTKVFYCTINRPQPTYVPNQHFLSMYSNWQLLSELTPDPLGLSASSAMSLYDSRHRPQSMCQAVIKQDLKLTHSSQWNKNLQDIEQSIAARNSRLSEDSKVQTPDIPKKELTGGFESNEEYTYVRGRGRGRYVCSECGIRCKKPSMLKKHIRTHTDVRPYTCIHCAFSFKTKGNLTKHMKSKAHYKKCCELGINPSEGTDTDGGDLIQSEETDDDTDTDGDEGNEGETESSDTEVSKSRLPEHEAAHCLLSLGGSRPATSATPGLITSARPTTYPYTPTGLEISTVDLSPELHMSRSSSVDSKLNSDNEPMDLSKTDVKPPNNIAEIPTARESSVLASLASNTAKLPQPQTQWPNGEPMLQTYLTERALLDSKIKQSQLTVNQSKPRKIDLEKSLFVENGSNHVTSITVSRVPIPSVTVSTRMIEDNSKVAKFYEKETKPNDLPVSKEENNLTTIDIPATTTETKYIRLQSTSNAENAKQVVSEYLKHARINLIKTHEDNGAIKNDIIGESKITKNYNTEDSLQEDLGSENESTKLPCVEIDSVARKVVIGVGGVAFKVSKGKEFENSSYSPGKLMEDGRRVCDFCNKTFTKPSQLRLHLNIHYMERPFRCSVCAVSFRTRGHLQKHERSGSHHNKVSMTSTFGAATSFNPRPFRCSDCNIAFRIHGHLAKHLRSKMHVMRLECLFKLPFGTFTEIERAGVSLTDIDTTDCASSLASLQSLAKKLHEKDPKKLEYRKHSDMVYSEKESTENEEVIMFSDICESEKDSELTNTDCSETDRKETQVSATDN